VRNSKSGVKKKKGERGTKIIKEVSEVLIKGETKKKNVLKRKRNVFGVRTGLYGL